MPLIFRDRLLDVKSSGGAAYWINPNSLMHPMNVDYHLPCCFLGGKTLGSIFTWTQAKDSYVK